MNHFHELECACLWCLYWWGFVFLLTILHSSTDISGLIAIPENKELLHERTRVASIKGFQEFD